MKKTILLITTMLILVSINFLIVKKEETLKNGRTMLLALAPVDPRSLMQGDYMILRYAIARNNTSDLEESGCIVITLDKNEVASYVRVHKNEPLKPDEHLLFYRNRGGMRLGAESFFFQEGDADLYSKAKYGELKVDESGQSVLVGLRGELFTPLKK
jgi:uncharacterized membrane-anchored protein